MSAVIFLFPGFRLSLLVVTFYCIYTLSPSIFFSLSETCWILMSMQINVSLPHLLAGLLQFSSCPLDILSFTSRWCWLEKSISLPCNFHGEENIPPGWWGEGVGRRNDFGTKLDQMLIKIIFLMSFKYLWGETQWNSSIERKTIFCFKPFPRQQAS